MEPKKSITEEVGETLDEIYTDSDEELRELSQEHRDVELFVIKTFPYVLQTLEDYKTTSTGENLQKLKASIDALRTQYCRIDQMGLTAEHLVSTLARLLEKLDYFMTILEEKKQEKKPLVKEIA